MLELLGSSLVGYIIGSIPIGYLLGRTRGIDITAFGSGKMGASNVHRALGTKAWLVTTTCDLGKGSLAAILGLLLAGQSGSIIGGTAAILGHIFPVFLRFRGVGRGVNTAIGAGFIISPVAAVAGWLIGLAVQKAFKFASLGSLIGAGVALGLMVGLYVTGLAGSLPFFYVAAAVTILIASHLDSIKRLLSGTERKLQL